MKKVTIYTLSTCLWCKKTKKYFEEKNIPFEAVDYDKQPEDRQEAMAEEMRAAGCTATFPFIKIGGKCTQGYNPNEFEELLKEK
jgi:glutaredoxin